MAGEEHGVAAVCWLQLGTSQGRRSRVRRGDPVMGEHPGPGPSLAMLAPKLVLALPAPRPRATSWGNAGACHVAPIWCPSPSAALQGHHEPPRLCRDSCLLPHGGRLWAHLKHQRMHQAAPLPPFYPMPTPEAGQLSPADSASVSRKTHASLPWLSMDTGRQPTSEHPLGGLSCAPSQEGRGREYALPCPDLWGCHRGGPGQPLTLRVEMTSSPLSLVAMA